MPNSKKYVDLHVHTNYSDGSFSPKEAVQYAKNAGLTAISITDHDITDGIPEAIEEGQNCGVEIIPGIELSAETELPNRIEVHILGYLIDWQNENLQITLKKFREARKTRADEIIKKLTAIGVNINTEHLAKMAGRGTIGRLHFARVMVEDGLVRKISDVFQLYLGFGKPAYVPKLAFTPKEAIDLITSCGGVPVLAHPMYAINSNENIINELSQAGLKGLEVWHTKHSNSAVQKFTDIAFEMGLIATGGSDCHGKFEDYPAIMGKVKVTYSAVEELKRYKESLLKKHF